MGNRRQGSVTRHDQVNASGETAAPIDRSAAQSALIEQGLLRVAEVAGFLRLSRASVYDLMRKGLLPWVKLGRARRIPRQAVVELAARELVGGWALIDRERSGDAD